MAKLGSVFLNTVFEDKPEKSVKITDHPIEGGLNMMDHIQRDPLTMSISGVVSGPDAETRKKQLESYLDKGTRLKYVYRTVQSDMIIEDFSAVYDIDIKQGFKFNISLKKIVVVKKAEKIKQKKKVTNGGRKQPSGTKPKRIYIVVKGDNLTKIGRKFGVSWQSIYSKNRKVIGSNPHLIYPKQRLVI